MKKGMLTTIIVIAVIVVIVAVFLFSNTNTYQSSNNGNGGTSAQTGSTGPTTSQILIRGMAFSPTPLDVKVGDTVTWVNQDNVAHTVTSDSGNELNSGTIAPGETYTHIFNTAGTYTYHCTIHPYMKGTVYVQ